MDRLLTRCLDTEVAVRTLALEVVARTVSMFSLQPDARRTVLVNALKYVPSQLTWC